MTTQEAYNIAVTDVKRILSDWSVEERNKSLLSGKLERETTVLTSPGGDEELVIEVEVRKDAVSSG